MNIALSIGALALFTLMFRMVFRLTGDQSSDRWWSLLLWQLGFAVLLRERPLGAGLEVFDGIEYLEMARSWIAHQDLMLRFHQMTVPARYDPIFPVMFIAPSLTFFSSYEAALIFPIAFSSLLPVLVYRVAVRWMPDPAARWCAVASAFLPTFREWSGTLMIDGVVAVTLLSQLLLAMQYPHTSSPRRRHTIWVVYSCLAAVTFGLRMTNLVFSAFLFASFFLRRPFPRWPAIAVASVWWVGVGIAIAVYRQNTFGTPLRSGYQYWTSVPYDFPSLVFSIRYVADNFRDFVNSSRVVDLSAIAVLAFLALKGVGGSARVADLRQGVGFAALMVAFYSTYFFPSARFLMPAEALLLLVAWMCVHHASANSRPRNRIAIAALATLFLALSKPPPRLQGLARHIDILSRSVRPGDTLVTSINPLFVEQRLANVKVVPISRRVEYASKIRMLSAPENQRGRPENPLDHRWPLLSVMGGQEMYDHVAIDPEFDLTQNDDRGHRTWLDLRYSKPDEVSRLREKYLLVAFSPQLALVRSRLSNYSPP